MSTAGADRPRVALLACDHPSPELLHVDGDYTDMFVRVFRAAGDAVEFDVVDVVAGAPLPPVGAHDAVLITGSRHSAYDDLPWIAALEEHLRELHADAVPTVGVCFGHQLIASALGGEVRRADAGWGVGVHEARALEPGVPERFRLLVSHQDQVERLPEGARLLATSDHAPVAAFQVGSLLGIQGHPEFSARYARALMAARRDRIPAPVITAGEATLATPTDHLAVTAWLARHLLGAQPIDR